MSCEASIARVDASLVRVGKLNRRSKQVDTFSFFCFVAAAIVALALVHDIWPPRALDTTQIRRVQ